MFSKEWMFEMFFMMLRGYLFKTAKLADVAKWGLRIRDYLLQFFPLEMYPVGSTDDPALKAAQEGAIQVAPVQPEDIAKAGKSKGFNIPFIKGM